MSFTFQQMRQLHTLLPTILACFIAAYVLLAAATYVCQHGHLQSPRAGQGQQMLHGAGGTTPAQREHLEQQQQQSSTPCTTHFKEYVSSSVEDGWVSQISKLRETHLLCELVRSEMQLYHKFWLPPADPFSSGAEEDNCTSHHVYERVCGTQRKETLTIPIEPLVALLRHPNVFCVSSDETPDLLRKDWLILPPLNFAGDARTKVLIDLGASLFASGVGGASQKWFWEEFSGR